MCGPVSLSPQNRTLLSATVTPLASIFGSGFLIIVPVLERGFGGAAVIAIAIVCVAALLVGTAIRHNIRMIGGGATADAGRVIPGLRAASAGAIALAYAISVGLYLQIMNSYALGYLGGDTVSRERLLSTAVIAVLVVIGVTRGFSGLERLETIALGATMLMITLMLTAFAVKVASIAADGGVSVPDTVGGSIFGQAALLGGILITVQGFETSRYLGAEYETEVRVRSSRLSQIIATVVYLAFVAICTPLMGSVGGGAPDRTLLDLAERTVPLLVLPLALTGVFSQFSAAIADLVTAVGNVFELSRERVSRSIAYVALGALAASSVWIFPIFTLVAVASRAFALFYAIECLIAGTTARTMPQRAGFYLLAAAMVFVVIFAQPVG